MEKKIISYMKPMVFFIRKKLKKNFFLEKKIQNGRLKKAHFPVPPIFIFFEKNFPGIGPVVSRIDWCEGH